jgi:hypothetical protein
MVPRQAGQRSGGATSSASRAARAARVPHDGQNAAPMNSRPKQDGHCIVASEAWQYWQDAASGATAAPQFGQCRAPAESDGVIGVTGMMARNSAII